MKKTVDIKLCSDDKRADQLNNLDLRRFKKVNREIRRLEKELAAMDDDDPQIPAYKKSLAELDAESWEYMRCVLIDWVNRMEKLADEKGKEEADARAKEKLQRVNARSARQRV